MTIKLRILLPALLLMAVSCSGNNEDPATDDDSQVKRVNVNIEQIEPGSFNSYLRVVGTVETSDDIILSAEVSGRVMEHLANEGQKVREGQTIIRINDSKLIQERSRLEAVTEQARENFERVRSIYEEEGIGSEIGVLNAKYSYEQSRSALESLKVDLANTSIKAPFNGFVEDIIIEVGEMAGPGMPVIRIIGSDQYKVTAGIPARYADVIETGDRVDIWFDTQYSDTLRSRLSFVGNSIDTQNRTFKAEAILPRELNFYKVDMIANMRLNTLNLDNVISISEEFVYKNGEDFVTYVLDEDSAGNSISRMQTIELGPSFQSEVIITSGLNLGDMLITTGSAFLNDGTRVKVLGDQSMASQ